MVVKLAETLLGAGICAVRGPVDGGPRWGNDSFFAQTGWTLAELEHEQPNWLELTPPEWHEVDRDRLATARIRGYSSPYDKEYLRRDGSRWPVIVAYALDGETGMLTVFLVDLTETRLAETARLDAERRYLRFFDVTNVAFWTADADGRATFSSAALAKRLGVAAGELDAAAQAALIHPDDRDRAIAAWEGALASGAPYDIEVRARSFDDGAHRWTRLRAFPDVAAGAIVGWYGTSEDIHERRLASDALAESEARFKQLADDIPAMVWLSDADGVAIYLSRSWCDYTGQTCAEGMGRGWVEAIYRADLPRLAAVQGFIDERRAFDLDFRVVAADGTARWMLNSGRPRFDGAGKFVGYAGAMTDIHDRKIAEDQLAEAQGRLSRALDGTGVGVWEWDASSDTVMISGSALGLSGVKEAASNYTKVDYRKAVHDDDRPTLIAAMDAYVEGRSDDFEVEIRIRRSDGGWVWVLDRGTATERDAAGRATRMVGTLTNIEDAKQAQARLRWTVEHDSLTGLPNRALFNQRLDAALAAGEPVALALLDIDHFKSVNDELGHAAGDRLLTVLAERLNDFAYPHETVARIGGDEFVLLMPGCRDAAAVVARLETLRRALDRAFRHDGKTLSCRASIGVTLSPLHGATASALLNNADVAMYAAKAGQRGAVAMFEPALGARVRGEAARLAEVRAALDAARIVPLYEPVMRLADGAVPGYEALPGIAGGDGAPIDAHGIDAAFGDPDLAIRLGNVMIDAVLANFAAWRARGVGPEFIALNVSLPELCRADYAARLLGRLAAHGVPPGKFRVEIVETGLNGGRGAGRGEATLAALSKGGVLVTLDNFGTGSASLSHLARLNLAAVKVDRQFIRGVALPGRDRTVVRAVTGLGKSFGLRVVALGVESAAQAAMCAEIGCTYGQGSYYGRPLDAAATGASLRG